MDYLNFKPEKSRISQSEKSELFNNGFAWCSKCKIVVTLEDITSNKGKFLGIGSNCKQCETKAAEARRAKKTITDDDRAKERDYRRLKRAEKASLVKSSIIANPELFKPSGKCVSNTESEALNSVGYRWCAKCESSLTIDNFSSKNYYCKQCVSDIRLDNIDLHKAKDSEYYQLNKDSILEKTKEYRESNHDKVVESRKKYYESNKDAILERNAGYREDNIESIRTTQKEYSKANRDKLRKSEKEWRSNNRDRINSRVNFRYNNDELFHLQQTCRALVRRAYLSIGTSKEMKTREFLGYTPLELKEHIESLFKDGMTWENHGIWHIDHIKPISKAATLEEGIGLSQLNNLQPLWAEENLLKGDKLI